MTAVAGTRLDSELSTDPLSTELISDVLARHYGLRDVTQEPLGGEVDQNVKITTADGHRFVLKASSAAADTAQLHWQNAVLAHLAEHAPDVAVPGVVPDQSGGAIVAVRRGSAHRAVRLLTWVTGDTLREVGYHPPELLTELGRVAGTLVRALSDMRQPDRHTSHDWDMRLAPSVIGDGINAIEDPACRADVEHIMAWYDEIAADLGGLPHQVVHQDLNDANVLVRRDQEGCLQIGVVDVNDALYTIRVAEIAVCAGYAMVRKDDPLQAAATVIAGFDSVVRLTDAELSVVFPLAAARLCMNATTWNRRVLDSGSRYGQDRMRHTWPAIRRIAQIVPEVAEAYIRRACGRRPRWAAGQLPEKLTRAGTGLTAGARRVEIDLAPGADLFDEIDWTDDAAVRDGIRHLLGDRSTAVGVTAHLRPTLLRSARREAGVREPATIQLGCGLLLPPGRTVPAPVAALVERTPSDDGPLVLRHDGTGRSVWTCWWGIEGCPSPGSALSPGAPLGTVSARPDNSGLDGHVQVAGVWSGRVASRPLPRHVRPAEADAWDELSFDPRWLLGLEALAGPPPRTAAAILASRREHFAKSQRAYYRRPMNLVRGRGTWLYDDAGLAYLDSLNNVTHVGHCEPRVTAAAHRQMRKLNTNSRFIYEGIASYAERLAATLPAPLEVVFLVCTGSEANDLALRIARQVTGRQDVVVLDGAYHGNTGVVTGISPNRYKGPGGTGAPPTTHEVPIPDRYRGAYGYDDPDAGIKFAADAARVIDGTCADGHPPATLIAESLMGTAGNIVLPDGYLAATFAAARAAGALCISDEVQVGVGRMGDSFWGFELGGVIPDIVTMGKPLGNGHPLAAVVTTRAIADAFDTGMKYFNTFGGNPVSCAVGQSVLDIVQQDGLQAHARELGAYFLAQLTELKSRHQLIGDVRGQGLYLGVELVRDPVTKQPAAAEASIVTELMKERGVITFPNGVHDNVLKIKPPMVFQRRHVDLYAHVLDEVLSLPQLRGPAALRQARSPGQGAPTDDHHRHVAPIDVRRGPGRTGGRRRDRSDHQPRDRRADRHGAPRLRPRCRRRGARR